ncbi:MAG: ATP-dependent Clp protease ATP-binding subunit ClpC, partial [Microcoleus sp. SIO2G3]|nr:ATP-dependent Clp protease ATP-binding subunit ClpC [Microcoleus sp. SIO2G3]
VASVWKAHEDVRILERVAPPFPLVRLKECYSPSYGARPLRRAIMRLLEDVLAEQILSGSIKDGDTAIVDVDEAGNVKVLPGENREEAKAIASGIE